MCQSKGRDGSLGYIGLNVEEGEGEGEGIEKEAVVCDDDGEGVGRMGEVGVGA